jgi:hypothetical protein
VIYSLTNTQFLRMLENFAGVLAKAEQFADAKKVDFAVLMGSRLAPDQFNFTRQVQIMCDTAKKAAAYLTGKEAPVHADDEKTLADLRKRLDDTAAFLKSLKPQDYEGASERKVSQPRWEGQWLTGEEFVLHHAVPNFYFHFTTAYSILRHNGVDVGKRDYLGKMPYRK